VHGPIPHNSTPVFVHTSAPLVFRSHNFFPIHTSYFPFTPFLSNSHLFFPIHRAAYADEYAASMRECMAPFPRILRVHPVFVHTSTPLVFRPHLLFLIHTSDNFNPHRPGLSTRMNTPLVFHSHLFIFIHRAVFAEEYAASMSGCIAPFPKTYLCIR